MKILFLTKYARLAANTRYRCLQYLPHLEKEGFQCDISPLLDDDYLKFKFSSGRFKISVVAMAYLWRLRVLLTSVRKYDAVVLHYELFPYFPAFFEWVLHFFRIPYVYDFDDAIFHQYEGHHNRLVRFLFRNKIRSVIKNSAAVMAGNDYLASYARQSSTNITVIPTVVDTERYLATRLSEPIEARTPTFTIGWIGSPSTAAYVTEKADVLKRFCSKFNARIVLVGSGNVDIPGLPLEIREWREDTELSELQQFDVGIMPLTDDVWTRGKCGFKLIQYMACGIPVVASPVGVNKTIVDHGNSGFLATSDDEWLFALERLYSDPGLRRQMGAEGRKRIEARYSIAAYAPKVTKILHSSIERIRVVHLISGLSAGGTEMMLSKLLSGMSKKRFENIVVAMTQAQDKIVTGRIERLGIKVHTLHMRSGVPDLLGAIQLVRLLIRYRPHILQTWLYHSDFLGLFAAKLCRIPALIWNIRCSYLDLRQYSQVTAFVVRMLARLSPIPNAIIVNSMAGLEYHKKLGYQPRRWELVPNGFDTDRFHPNPLARESIRNTLNIDAQTPVIGMVARFDPMKDHRTFLLAASDLLKVHPEVHFVLVGRGVTLENPSLFPLIESTGRRAQFHLLGERSDISEILPALDIFSLSSRGEGFPNVIGEAMSSGVPCVVTNAGDSGHIVDGVGRVVPVGDPAALSHTWGEILILSERDKARMCQQARKRIVTSFNLPAIVKRYESIYRSQFYSRTSSLSTQPVFDASLSSV